MDLALARSAVLASAATLGELGRVIARRKLRRYLEPEEGAAFLAMYSRRAVPVLVTSGAEMVRDPADNAFVNLAIDGRADFLVSGDSDLLVLGAVGATRIVTPAMFVEAISQSHP